MSTVRFAIRADASSQMGSGHVMRCLTLADGLRRAGAGAVFVSREHAGHLCDLIERRGYQTLRLPRAESKPVRGDDLAHAPWLGASWEDDAQQTAAAITAAGVTPDWWIVDHYGIDARWLQRVRRQNQRIAVIDDLADRVHDCDVLLDQNLMADMTARYQGRVSAGTLRLLGPDYALLSPTYAELRRRIPPRSGPVRRIMAFFGGADGPNLTGRALEAFLALGRTDLLLDLVITGSGSRRGEIVARASGRTNVVLHEHLPSLAPLLARADLSLGAGGSSSWERLCLGLPTVIVTLAENQRPIASALQAHGLAEWLGHEDTVSAETIHAALARITADGLDPSWSQRCSATVDGHGVRRVVSVLLSDHRPLRSRYVQLGDRRVVADGLATSAFESRLRDLDGTHWYLFTEPEGERIGDVLFQNTPDGWIGTPRLHQVMPITMQRRLLEAGWARLRRDCAGALVVAPGTATGGLQVTIACASGSWLNDYIPQLLVGLRESGHQVTWIQDRADLEPGDVCFLLGFTQILSAEALAQHRSNVVVHESALPHGRGWSPLTWQVLEGRSTIPVSLIEAARGVDSGAIYLRDQIALRGTELVDELREAQARVSFRLCRRFLAEFPSILKRGQTQRGEATYYERRGPEDSRLSLERPLAEQLDLLRTVDNERYPAWIDLRGRTIRLRVEPMQ